MSAPCLYLNAVLNALVLDGIRDDGLFQRMYIEVKEASTCNAEANGPLYFSHIR